MRILMIAPSFPLPAFSGSKIRIWSILRALTELGHQVTLLAFHDASDAAPDEDTVRRFCNFEVIRHEMHSVMHNRDYVGRLRSFCTSLPYGVARFRSRAMRERIAAHLDRTDLVFCETGYMPVNVPEDLPVPMVIDNQNLEHVLFETVARMRANPLVRVYGLMEARKLKAWGIASHRRAASGLFCSKNDMDGFSALCQGVSTAVVPNVVDPGAYAPAPAGGRMSILFCGAMDWYPNQDATSFFVQRILPEIRRHIPEAELVVAGKRPSAAIARQFASVPGIRFTGTVPDMSAVIAEATVCVIPLRIGSGTRLKILEMAAMAKPIVSTRLGAEGLDFVDGEEIVLADNAPQFASAVVEILRDPQRAGLLGAAARRRVECSYNFTVLRQALSDSLQGLVPVSR
jgi:polysaccharide biosynthesis protein PslH